MTFSKDQAVLFHAFSSLLPEWLRAHRAPLPSGAGPSWGGHARSPEVTGGPVPCAQVSLTTSA